MERRLDICLTCQCILTQYERDNFAAYCSRCEEAVRTAINPNWLPPTDIEALCREIADDCPCASPPDVVD